MSDPASVPILHGFERDDVMHDYDIPSDHEDHHMTDNDGQPKKSKKQCPDLDVYTKWAMVVRVIQETNRATKRLKTGSLDILTAEFGVSKRTVQRVYTEYTSQIEQGILVPDMTSKKPDRCGADSKLTPEVAENIRNLRNKIKGKVTARGMADAYEAEYGYKMPYMTLYRYDRKLNGK
uniref:Uncharacterized protein n=1 Tax=Spumella elongata TaxID=89044 RepID=A0A7S3MJP0_9STRA|mmetsp:Transcript_7671/g.12915  ORF Transcript_7671/g.12915 Transcript_7671/m.12915 type:complete len:178 (+) Transcript_7671:49-582(+)|eukprot:CAMPEP_0184985344 /NCGR_PEP_ID=MMETSP1098-20130426/14067_1 /TAXON_ID=89044 /ORGANISM="Spumella elongata, Strain CCAP 955/1" /LENGTH=177 /DNA_ID=CAMNT_0027509429 /DNA_START=49 /DNA_END=582 /DNA_ORIENTATION=-